jgi:hypothetical protein
VVFPPPISGAIELYIPTKPEMIATFCDICRYTVGISRGEFLALDG